ncbi:MAG: hypothetical protein A3F40_03550 [Chlamydiae bacterium RIFCSPHIGHO2_12_FULL_27_8]|nr:MAG: hypothetical protein A3F40_03550 [Chlamydiae bacterium RIFCSPHIGHO2_12_FULL_27_8]OGN64982.1 MAG: hypothetical protein A2888_01660 [Chlamydiae bacterium RIFCSPLOWO2_01_FULL_28_7]
MQIEPESFKVIKIKEKLINRLNDIDHRVYPDNIAKKTNEIYEKIAKHPNRCDITKKSIALFDENSTSAKISNKIAELFQNIPFKSDIFYNLNIESDSIEK